MAPRPAAMANQVADALLTALEVVKTPADAYLSVPLTVIRGQRPDWATCPQPALFLRLVGFTGNEPGTAGIHRVTAQYEVLCITAGPPDSEASERVLIEMATDVVVALYQDFQLGGLLSSGWMHLIDGYQPQLELGATAAHLAVASVVLSATWEWTPAAP